jgi:hypothetical protein
MPSCDQLDVVDPSELAADTQALEELEKNTINTIVDAMDEYKNIAALAFKRADDIYPHEIFHDPNTQGYYRALADVGRAIGEDVTEMALDSEGIISERVPLSGRTDHKMVRTVPHPDKPRRRYGQALMVDSKAEKEDGTSTIQRSQTSLDIRFKNTRKDKSYDESGNLPKVINSPGGPLIPTTVLVKYKYDAERVEDMSLEKIIVSCIPHGYLQNRYNKNVDDGQIWRVGRDSPKHDENFRVRLRYDGLKKKASWRVQQLIPGQKHIN